MTTNTGQIGRSSSNIGLNARTRSQEPLTKWQRERAARNLAIRQAYKPGVVTQTMLSKRFGVSQSTIHRILSGDQLYLDMRFVDE